MARGFDIEASNQGQLNSGPVVGPRSKYNFVETAGGLVIAVTDNPGNDSVDVAFDSSGLGGGVSGAADAGAAVGPQPTIRLIAGANITIGLVEDIPGNELEFTIAGSAGAFPGYGGTPPQDAGAGSAGVAGTASRSDHSHPSSTTYTNRDGIEASANAFKQQAASFVYSHASLGTTSSFRPRFVFTSFFVPSMTGAGCAFTSTPSTQIWAVLVNAQTWFNGGCMGNHVATERWYATMTSTTTSMIHAVGAGQATGLIITVGDNL